MNTFNKQLFPKYMKLTLIVLALFSIFFGVRALIVERKVSINNIGPLSEIFPSVIPTIPATPIDEPPNTVKGSVTPSVTTSVKPTDKVVVTPIPKFSVTKVEITSSVLCVAAQKGAKFPYVKTFTATGSITTDGPGKVTYHWQSTDKLETLVFLKAGKMPVKPTAITLELVENAPYRYERVRLLTESPRTIVSNTLELALYNNTDGKNPCRR